MSSGRERAAAALVRLMDLVARLRGPQGCPWDRQQTLASVTPYLLEEAFEAAEAVEQAPEQEAMAELGDLLFQIIFLVQLYAEEGRFDLARVIEAVEAKMIRRHPHVFGPEKAANAEAVRQHWGRLKEQEKAGRRGGLLDGVPRGLPALARAKRLGQRAATVGFDWDSAQAVWDKVNEEMGELTGAADQAQLEAELGDVLFALAQWARHRSLDPEAALRRANARFARRVKAMERLARARGQVLTQLDAEALDDLWQEVKPAAPR